ncbi:hypothetical protein A3E89_01815 [Candidatus Campbellbacteria bacterium RIFCSPHIGHO2_12_FULL_35_10]|uniref:Uncharacterized protein n=1 Tax=Candidatus Campbellbacteria bacterium RIFCSPHIGHO2_12_FULL_35_10 TaxID=1797578 RepID=A0A1F5EMS8_9BACT|nr:MAG: hypothetical protein A3E89_01815 [Candidatus Campbellbacteria bacterium RIFCSPHIGHO2_12_FULL_35_10]
MKKYYVLGLASLLAPSIVLAADATSILGEVKKLIGLVVPLIISLAVIFFLYGLVGYMTKAGDKKDDAQQTMIWGIIILFVMVSIWGLVNLIQETFDIRGNEGTVTNPLDKIPGAR